MTNDDTHDAPRIHPDELDTFELCHGCPECDALAAEFFVGLEVDLRQVSLDLWVAGWLPADLIADVRRTTGDRSSAGLIAQLLIVDDSHRSAQARPAVWLDEIERLRARTGADDVAAGWLARWVAGQREVTAASACLHATICALGDLVDPRSAI